LIRIDEQNGPRYVQLVKNPDVTKYDVIVDEAATSPNRKEAVWGMIVQMMPLLGKMPPQIMGKLFEYSPLPEALGQEISQALQQPPPPDPKAQALMMKAQMDQQGKQQDMTIAQQTAQMDMAQQQQQMQMDAAAKQQEMAFEREKFAMEMQMDQAKFHQEVQQDQMMGQIKLHEAQQVGEQKLAIGQQQADAKAAQMKKMAAAKPKPTK
jgi:hypothetical protein